jgi:hypothetical protein
MDNFEIKLGKFWVFVFSSVIAIFVALCLEIAMYFAVYAEGVATSSLPYATQIAASDTLMWMMGFLLWFIFYVWTLTMVTTFYDQLQWLWNKITLLCHFELPPFHIDPLVVTGLEISIWILFTTICFCALVVAILILPTSIDGNMLLVPMTPNDSTLNELPSLISIFAMTVLICHIVFSWITIASSEYLVPKFSRYYRCVKNYKKNIRGEL